VCVAGVYLFSFKGLVFTCSASRLCCFCFSYAYCTKFCPSCKPQSGHFSRFVKNFISRSDCREASITSLLQCRNQRPVCGDLVLFHDPSRDGLEKTHAFVLSFCCCCFHMRIVPNFANPVNPNQGFFSLPIYIIDILHPPPPPFLRFCKSSCKSLGRRHLRRAGQPAPCQTSSPILDFSRPAIKFACEFNVLFIIIEEVNHVMILDDT
jgi:hypothetical protein